MAKVTQKQQPGRYQELLSERRKTSGVESTEKVHQSVSCQTAGKKALVDTRCKETNVVNVFFIMCFQAA